MSDKPIDYKEAVRMHVEKFGFEPVITGINFWQSDELLIKILEAIDSGNAYIEDEVPENVVI